MTKYRILSVGLILGAIALAFFIRTTEMEGSRFPFRLGLDLAGGTELAYEADVSGVASGEVTDAMTSLRQVVERRVNSRDFSGVFGVLDPIVQIENSSFLTGETKHRLIVELPGVTDVDEAKEFIGKTPVLEFKLVNDEKQIDASSVDENGNLTISDEDIYLDTGLTGRYLKRAQLQFSGGQTALSEPFIAIEFNDEGAELFAEITREHQGEALAIFLDGVLLSSPIIQEEIRGGNAQISGDFTPQEAKDLVRDLNFGALPLPIELVGAQKIGPVIGGQTVESGVQAGIWGLIIVSIFLLIYYRLPGFISILTLALYVILVLSLFKLIPVTLTAAGIAGFILSIGMAVDANVLIFERLKEEIKEGKKLSETTSDAFSKAWPSIRDANLSSLIMAVILFWFGTSIVQGFALVFGIGVIVSMFSAVVSTRMFLMSFEGDSNSKLIQFLFGNGLRFSRKSENVN